MDDPIPSDILSAISEEYIGQKPSLFITICACLFSVSFPSKHIDQSDLKEEGSSLVLHFRYVHLRARYLISGI